MVASSPRPALPILPGEVRRGLAPSSEEVRRLSSGDDALDRLIGGGFVRGELSEVTGPSSSGRTSIAYRLLAAATARGESVALVDAVDSFDPKRAAAAGVGLESLLWVRSPGPLGALRAAETLLAMRDFAVVILDLADGIPVASEARLRMAWTRLRLRSAAARAVLLVLSRRRLAGSSADLCLALGRGRAAWARSPGMPLLVGLETRAEVVRDRRGTAGGEAELRFEDR